MKRLGGLPSRSLGRQRRDGVGPAGHRLDLEARGLEIRKALRKRLDLFRGSLEEDAEQKALRKDPARCDAVADPLVKRALVGGVLVDDEKALGTARQDVGLAVL